MTDTISLHFRSDAPFQQIMDNGDNRIILLSFEKGQILEEHQVPISMTVLVLSGQVQFVVSGEETENLESGHMIVLQPGQVHSLKAVQKSTILLTLFAASDESSEQTGEHVSVHTNPEMMKNIAPELKELVEDHNALCEELLNTQGELNLTEYKKTLDLIGDELNHHFVFEETILFPRIAKLIGGADVGPIAMLIREHGKIRKLYASCDQLLKDIDTDPYAEGALRKLARRLTNILLKHIEKEDKFIFPMASRILSKEDLEVIERELMAVSNS